MRRVLIALSMVALLWIPAVRSWVEGSMTRHMLIGLPLLVAAGVMAGAGWARAARQGSAWNPGGIPGALLALGCSAAIMVPRVLDAAVQSLAADAIKSALALLAGAALAASWRALGSLGQAFVVGNAGWMLGAAGLLLQQAPERLCVQYLQGDQRRAGVGLVIAAVLIVAGWLASAPWRDELVADPATMRTT
jgi:hypothetical protein